MNTISFSEAATLALCEERWYRKYRQRDADSGTRSMHLGLVLHDGINLFYQGVQPEEIIERVAVVTEVEMDEPMLDDVAWLLDRYCRVYADEPARLQGYEPEVEIEFALGSVLVRTRIDALKRDADGRLWVVERKTMSDWSRLEFVPSDPQVTLYWLAAVERGLDVYGIEYDAIRTYRWQRDERPPEDSVRRLYLDRTHEQAAQAITWLWRIMRRRDDLDAWMQTPGAAGGPIRNAHAFVCRTCPYRVPCLEGMIHLEADSATD